MGPEDSRSRAFRPIISKDRRIQSENTRCGSREILRITLPTMIQLFEGCQFVGRRYARDGV